jgi:triacylglycerol lipase
MGQGGTAVRRACLIALFACALLSVWMASRAHARAPGPPLSVPSAQLENSLRCPSGASHPQRPWVLLVHGTGTTGEDTWPDGLGAALDHEGADWCMVTIPGRELGDIQDSAEHVVHAVRELHARDGRDVSLVGHSQGADLIRWAVRWWPDVRASVDDVVTIEGANQGVPVASAVCQRGACAPAVWQYRIGSNFLAALNRVPTPAGPAYTAIGSLTDELLQPGLPTPTSTYRIPGDGATNVLVQQLCPGRPVTHGAAVFDAAELAIVQDALAHDGAARLDRIGSAPCARVYAPGIDPVAATSANLSIYAGAAGPTLLGPQTGATREPPLRPWAR